MSDLVVAVALLACTVALLWPRRARRERDDGPLSRRAVRHLLDDDEHRSTGNQTDQSP